MPRKKSALGRQLAETQSVPAPIGGLNARDALANMPATDALILDNMFPTPSSVDVRNGYINWKTGLPGWVETIMHYNGQAAKKLFCASVTGFYDCTITGAVGAAVQSGLTNARWQSVNIATAGSTFLLAVNGSDKLRGYNGSAWWADGDGTHDIAGVDSATLIHITLFQHRVWMTQKNSTKAWYLPIDSIGGTAISFDFGPLFKLGGYLMGMMTWTVEGNSGTQEFLVAMSSEGEALVYQGYDPSSASTFYQVGNFRVGRPIGRRFYCKSGSDVAMITADGIFALSQALLKDRSQGKAAMSDKIVNLISSDVRDYNAAFGWQPILYPMGGKLLINVPQTENSRQYQYVMNTITGAWCTFGKFFSPWNAACFEFFNDALYFGGNGIVAQCDTGTQDNGGPIVSDAKQAFNYFGERGREKYFTMCRPILVGTGNINLLLGLNMDYSNDAPASNPDVSTGSLSPWDTSPWDTSSWAGDGIVTKDWQSLGGIGYAAALRLRMQTSDVMASWQSTDFVYQPGGIL